MGHRFAVIGRMQVLLDATRLLLDRGHEVPLVATCRPAPEHTVGAAQFRAVAESVGADFIETQNLNTPDVIARLQRAEVDAAVSVNWVSLIGADAIDSCAGRVLNLHGGDLPRYRGNAPFAWAMLAGENSVGLTVHMMDPLELDAGPVVLKAHHPIDAGTLVGDLYRWLDEVGPALLADAAEGLAGGRIEPTDQALLGLEPVRCYPRRPADGRIDWQLSATDLDRLVRASSEPFAGAFCELDGDQVVVWRAAPARWRESSLAVPGQVTAIDRASGIVSVATGDGILELSEVETDGAGRGPAAGVIRSSRSRLS